MLSIVNGLFYPICLHQVPEQDAVQVGQSGERAEVIVFTVYGHYPPISCRVDQKDVYVAEARGLLACLSMWPEQGRSNMEQSLRFGVSALAEPDMAMAWWFGYASTDLRRNMKRSGIVAPVETGKAMRKSTNVYPGTDAAWDVRLTVSEETTVLAY